MERRPDRMPRHGGRLALGSQYAGRPLLDFSVNTAPVRVLPAVLKALRTGAAARASEYPDPRSGALVAELSKYTGMPESHIIAGNGATEIIYNTVLVLGGGRGTKMLVQAPTFSEYEAASRTHHKGSRVVRFASMDVSSDLEMFVSKIPEYGMVFVCNPNNPTGRLLRQKEILRIVDAAAASRSCHVVVDECFVELSSDPRESVMSRVPEYDNLTVLRSLTKSFGLPGIRAGYAVSHPRIIDALYEAKVPWSISGIAEAAGVAALADSGRILDKARDIIRREVPYVLGRLGGVDGITCYDTDANFVLLKTKYDSAALQEELASRYGILVRDCSNFRGLGRHHVRVAIRGHRDNIAMTRALRAAHGAGGERG